MRLLRLLPAVLLAAGCGVAADSATPACTSVERLAAVAQSVPSAGYVPCVQALPAGWETTEVEVRSGSSRVVLLSDRNEGRPVVVELAARCDVSRASPTTPRGDGVRSYLRLDAVSPVYVGTRYDVFPGGCVRYDFAFARGAHIPLMEELTAAVELVPRRQLRLDVRERLGVELDP